MRQEFAQWLPRAPLPRFFAKQAIILGVTGLMCLLTSTDYSAGLMAAGALIFTFWFALNIQHEPEAGVQDKRPTAQEGQPPHPHGLVNHPLVVGAVTLILSVALGFV